MIGNNKLFETLTLIHYRFVSSPSTHRRPTCWSWPRRWTWQRAWSSCARPRLTACSITRAGSPSSAPPMRALRARSSTPARTPCWTRCGCTWPAVRSVAQHARALRIIFYPVCAYAVIAVCLVFFAIFYNLEKPLLENFFPTAGYKRIFFWNKKQSDIFCLTSCLSACCVSSEVPFQYKSAGLKICAADTTVLRQMFRLLPFTGIHYNLYCVQCKFLTIFADS